jgi:hypothetical protein
MSYAVSGSFLQRLFSAFPNGWPGIGVLLQQVLTATVGLWTPVAGTMITIVELWIVHSSAGGLGIPIILATLGATMAMIGPGAAATRLKAMLRNPALR